MSKSPVYDQIGLQYNQTRKADPFITSELYELLEVDTDKKYLDIGCGTGNYLKALLDKNTDIFGVDPSDIMLQVARSKDLDNRVVIGNSEQIPFPALYFKGTMAVLTTHHWPDLFSGFKEINRVMEVNGILVIFTFTPEQVNHYWLKEYFPKMILANSQKIPDLKSLRQTLMQSGFKVQEERVYFIQKDLQDQFMYAHKYRPERYLEEDIRNGISAFRLAPDPDEINAGLMEIKKDIDSGKIYEIINGNYIPVGTKQLMNNLVHTEQIFQLTS